MSRVLKSLVVLGVVTMALLSISNLSYAHPVPNIEPQIPVGQADTKGIVQSLGLSKIKFPVICATNRKWHESGYASLDSDTADLPTFVLKYCSVDMATHQLGRRSDFVLDSQFGPHTDLEKLLGEPFGPKRYLVFVHGFNCPFDDSVTAVSHLCFDINRHSLPVLFTWPSGGGQVGTDYVAARDNTREAGDRLAKALAFLQARAGSLIEVDLVSHSLGGEVAIEALRNLDSSRYEDVRSKIVFKNIVFVAPDVSEKDFRRCLELPVFGSTRTTLYTCSHDAVLALPSAAINYNERVGLKTGFLDPRVENVDVSRFFSGASVAAHTSVLIQPMGLMDLFLLLKHDLPAEQRNLYWSRAIYQLRN